VATPFLRINLFVAAPACLLALAGLPAGGPAPMAEIGFVAAGALLLAGGALWSFRRRAARRGDIAARARAAGLSSDTATQLGRLFESDGPDAVELLLAEPESLRRRLAHALREARDDAAARRLSTVAARLFAELSPEPPFAGAPAPFSELRLWDPADPRTPDVPAFVLAADERSLLLTSRADCPWPARRTLRAAPPGARGVPPVELRLLLRPAYPSFEWVVTHQLVGHVANRRAAVRVPCRLQAVLLPDGDDAAALRARLLRDEAVDESALVLAAAWARRDAVTVLDLSPDGARLALQREVRAGQRFHLVLRRADGPLAALPLAEVVSVNRTEDGGLRAGVRFVTIRLRERLRLAEFVRGVERGATAGGATAVKAAAEVGERSARVGR
jgi:hypothetical protein